MAAAGGNPYKVILVGEKHGDDLGGEALTDVFGKFQTKYGDKDVNDFVIYYETPFDHLDVSFKYQKKNVKRVMLPLEEITVIAADKENFFDNVLKESLPSEMSSIFYLLDALSKLMLYYLDPQQFDEINIKVNGRVGDALDSVLYEIRDRIGDVIVNILPGNQFSHFRNRMTEIFPSVASLRLCFAQIKEEGEVVCKEKFIHLYQIVLEYFELFKTFHEKYSWVAFPMTQESLMGIQIQMIERITSYETTRRQLIGFLQTERDTLMVRKLQSSIEGGDPRKISVVVVGDGHFVNMKKLLSAPPFEVIFDSSTQLEPQRGAIVRIQDFKSRPDLNGQFGIVVGDSVVGSNGIDETTPVFCFDRVEQLKRENFEVLDVTPREVTVRNLFPNPAQYAMIKAKLKSFKGALVKVQGLMSNPDLNGQDGIVVGDSVVGSNGIERTPVSLKEKDILLKRENFEFLDLTPSDDTVKELFGDAKKQYLTLKSKLILFLGGDSKRYKKGSKLYKKYSKLYKKGSKRRCYARTRKGKRSKRRSAKK